MFMLQRWGASQEQGRALVSRLVAVAGHRLPHLDELFDRMDIRVRWDGKRRIAWLQEQAERMAADPVYWPVQKKQSAKTGVDTVLVALQSGPKTKAKLVGMTGKTEVAIASLTQSLCDAGWIVRLKPGVYALPAAGTETHVSATDAVLAALTTASKPRSAIDAAIFRLKKAGASSG